jgi:hypothetical protein
VLPASSTSAGFAFATKLVDICFGQEYFGPYFTAGILLRLSPCQPHKSFRNRWLD